MDTRQIFQPVSTSFVLIQRKLNEGEKDIGAGRVHAMCDSESIICWLDEVPC